MKCCFDDKFLMISFSRKNVIFLMKSFSRKRYSMKCFWWKIIWWQVFRWNVFDDVYFNLIKYFLMDYWSLKFYFWNKIMTWIDESLSIKDILIPLAYTLYNVGIFAGMNVHIFLIKCIVYYWWMLTRGHTYI